MLSVFLKLAYFNKKKTISSLKKSTELCVQIQQVKVAPVANNVFSINFSACTDNDG